MSGNTRARGWCFTINHWTREDLDEISALDYRYIVTGFETGESGTAHIQGYVLFRSAITFSSIKRKLTRAHLEAAKGTPQQNLAYCSKDGEWCEDGDRPFMGGRSDLDQIRTLASVEGMRGVTRVGNLQQMRVAAEYLKYNEEPRNEKTHVSWFWGDSGAGKSRTAKEMAGDDVYYKDATKWWDAYDGESTVIWDDIRGDVVPVAELLRLFDRFEHRVEVKGSTRQFTSKRIIVTSIRHPRDLFHWTPEEPWAQMARRVEVIRHFELEEP